jgi:antitoxin ParD1/3/4
MAGIHKRTFSLPKEHSSFIDEKVSSGAYASGSEVVRAGLRALQERDAAVERWLRDEVAPAYDRWAAGEEETLSIEEVFDSLKAELEARSAKA